MSEQLVQGWRIYEYTDSYHVLAGTYLWWYDAKLTAKCLVLPDDDGRAAANHLTRGTCSCGIYILRDRPSKNLFINWWRPVLVYCTGWGAIAEYERGWRVQYAKIERILVPADLCAGRVTHIADGLRQRYHVPVDIEEGEVPCEYPSAINAR
jgi:hypothetical protein